MVSREESSSGSNKYPEFIAACQAGYNRSFRDYLEESSMEESTVSQVALHSDIDLSDDAEMQDADGVDFKVARNKRSLKRKETSQDADRRMEKKGKKEDSLTIQQQVSSNEVVTPRVEDREKEKLPIVQHQLTRGDKEVLSFGRMHKAPYIVHIWLTSQGKAVKAVSILNVSHRLDKASTKYNKIEPYCRNEWILQFSSRDEANRSLVNRYLVEQGFKAYVPTYAHSRKGKVWDIPTDIPLDEIRAAIVEGNPGLHIGHVFRLKKRVVADGRGEWSDSGTVGISFLGQSLPEYLYIWRARIQVAPFVDSVKICFGCGGEGHVRKNYSKSARCLHCSLEQHLGPGQKCEGIAKCINCQGNHRTLDRSCPVYRKAESINRIMACDNLPSMFARRCYENSSGQARFSEKQMDFPSLPIYRGGTSTGNTQSPLQTHQNGRIQKP